VGLRILHGRLNGSLNDINIYRRDTLLDHNFGAIEVIERKKVVVIGSGLAGTLICNELAESADVILLEAGAKSTIEYPKIQFLRKDFGVAKTFCIGGGGTTNLWDNGLIPINLKDLSCKEFYEVINDAGDYMDRAASKLFFKNMYFSNEYENVLYEMKLIADKIGILGDGIDCLLYPKKYKRLIVNPKVKAFYSVHDINISTKNKRIENIKFYIKSKEFYVKPDIVIICAGSLGTPSLVKKILHATGYSFVKLGTGFIDHPMGFVGKVKLKKSLSKYVRKIAMVDKGNFICHTAIRLKSECGKYTCCAYLRPALTMKNQLDIYKYKSLLGASKGKERIKKMFSWRLFHPDILAEIFLHIFGFSIPSRIYNILVIAEQKNGKNRVTYDENGLKVDWCITGEELSIYNNILKKLNGRLLKISEKINIKTEITEEWLWSAAHHSGTISLGKDPEGLIDKNLRLNCCENVFVCDGSVIQEHSYANTGLTIGQLAMRLAERVIKDN